MGDKQERPKEAAGKEAATRADRPDAATSGNTVAEALQKRTVVQRLAKKGAGGDAKPAAEPDVKQESDKVQTVVNKWIVPPTRGTAAGGQDAWCEVHVTDGEKLVNFRYVQGFASVQVMDNENEATAYPTRDEALKKALDDLKTASARIREMATTGGPRLGPKEVADLTRRLENQANSVQQLFAGPVAPATKERLAREQKVYEGLKGDDPAISDSVSADSDTMTSRTKPAAGKEAAPAKKETAPATSKTDSPPANEPPGEPAKASFKAHFEQGKSEPAEFDTPPKDIAKVVHQAPGKRLLLDGHASSEGRRMVNHFLSFRRVSKVREILQAAGVPGDRMPARAEEAHGENDAKKTEQDDKGHGKSGAALEDARRENRRVDITVVGKG